MRRFAVLLAAAVLAGCAGGVRGPVSWGGAPSPGAAPAAQTPIAGTSASLAEAAALVDATRREAAPDRRTDRFDVSVRDSLGRLFLVGETTDPAALDRLVAQLPGPVTNAVRVLPDTAALGPLRYALAAISVVNLRSEPRESAELASQTLMGWPMRILDRRGGWLLAQTPDRYLGWVDASTVERMDASQMTRQREAHKVVFADVYGFVRAEPNEAALPVSDVVAGSLLEETGLSDDSAFVRVALPDGRTGYVRANAVEPFDAWAASRQVAPLRLVATAESLTGLPYLWGGTSTKGMDCSGFTRTVFLMNGMLLPRDASQQVRAGTTVDSTGNWASLQPGDLLFFGRKAQDGQPERVVHVGMWVGDGRYIHSSGRVQIQRLDDPSAPDFNAYDRNRYLRTKRVDEGDRLATLLRAGALYEVVGR